MLIYISAIHHPWLRVRAIHVASNATDAINDARTLVSEKREWQKKIKSRWRS